MKICKKTKLELVSLAALLLALSLVFLYAIPALAAETAEVEVKATGAYIAIADNVTTIDFGVVVHSTTSNTSEDYVGITNSSSVQTDISISANDTTWTSSGTGWTHSETATAGANTAGLLANQDGTWGVSDIVIKNASPNYLYENCPASTSFDYGIGLQVPTSFTDGQENSITVTVTAVSG